ncbi:F0F1 ATP synthase subunit delta [Actinoplanes sp. NPDC051494]|uniref:F0F1 ATP synthase subunit delta n=1 Tax=Actinoplanes sp. NPDC051494 TaxID=3363907 RepID=UPI00379E6724
MMAAVNREAYAAAAEKLTADSASVTAAQLATIADEILAVARLLRGEPGLRRALTDPSRSGDERAALLRSLIVGKLSVITVDTLGVLVSGRWSRPSDLLDATERLAVDTVLAAADRDGKLAEVEDELFRFGQVVSGNGGLSVTLSDSGAPVERRAKLVEDLLKGKSETATVQLVKVALEGFGGRNFDAALSKLVELTAEKRDREVAYVTSARLLDDAEEQRLAAKLSGIYGRQVSLKVEVKPSVLGGLSVRVGSDLYDGTILRRLQQARQAIAN